MMGPTNVALRNLHRADQQLREAQERYDGAARGVRVQERRINELSEKLRLLQAQLREQQARGGQLDLEIKAKEARIERFRVQQQDAKNHKEYTTFLQEINTEKIDKGKLEDEYLKVMEAAEKMAAEVKELEAQLDGERKIHEQTKAQLAGRLAALQAEVERLKPIREAAAKATPPRALAAFERLAERYEGEAVAAIQRPDRRREEYLCTACNMTLVADVYNRLRSKDEMVPCPSCHRLLFIPEDLTPETAINKPRERRERSSSGRKLAAAIGRQTSAVDVLKSMQVEEDAPPPAQQEQPAPPPDAPSDAPAKAAEPQAEAPQPSAPQQNP